jgi:hypothetical protein
VVLDTLEKDTMHATWYNVLKSEFSKPYFESVRGSFHSYFSAEADEKAYH